jgi:hypothetical protein
MSLNFKAILTILFEIISTNGSSGFAKGSAYVPSKIKIVISAIG